MIYVIILNYNNAIDTISCIKSIQNSNLTSNFKLIVVDNASTDDSVFHLNKQDGIVLLESDSNGGYASGNNIGLRYCRQKNDCNSILISNNDVIYNDKVLRNIINSSNKKIDEVYVPGVHEIVDGVEQLVSGKQYINLLTGKHRICSSRYQKWIVPFINGACFLLPRAGCELYFEESYFLYWEDVDFSLRLNELGCPIKFDDSTHVVHALGASTKKNPDIERIKLKSLVNFYKRNYPALIFFPISARILKAIINLDGKRLRDIIDAL